MIAQWQVVTDANSASILSAAYWQIIAEKPKLPFNKQDLPNYENKIFKSKEVYFSELIHKDRKTNKDASIFWNIFALGISEETGQLLDYRFYGVGPEWRDRVVAMEAYNIRERKRRRKADVNKKTSKSLRSNPTVQKQKSQKTKI